MNKILRYAFVAAMTAISSFTFAQTEAKFDFVPENSYELFGLTGLSSQSSNAGDITETKSATVDGVTITATVSNQKNPNRFWKGSFRMYGGTLSLKATGKKITSILYALYFDKWGAGNSFEPEGTVEDIEEKEGKNTYKFKKWTGEAEEVVLNVVKNTQLRSITVTYIDATGIETVETINLNENAPMYNLAGQRVAKNYKGVVIQNGKKFINK
ncbi:hypothetical protein [Prevotella sp. HUN102]|uniref:hypothetical protein n=1 Tax=Prevotella sp. HUN102 TaxID=1392486 RepID=UPI00048D2A64|nr:hypothetical protein [Prevotella sp. HUN102]